MRLFLITLHITGVSILLFQQVKVEVSERSKPRVDLHLSNTVNDVSWGSQIRYSIEVSDQVDGDSKYDEINPQEVFLEINFVPGIDSSQYQDQINDDIVSESLKLIGKNSCFGCHADKEIMIGPSFSEIANEYEKNQSTIKELVNSIQNGSTGRWADAEMPANPDISEEDASAMMEYILTQGAKDQSWVVPGLEGVFRIIDKPQSSDQGTYMLTASYRSSLEMRGAETKTIRIK